MTTVALAHDIDGPADGTAVVLLHSIGTDRRLWRAHVAPLVADGLRVISVDLRGHGGSPVPDGPYAMADLGGDVVSLLDRLGITRAHVVGVSIGGAVGLWLAAHRPDRVSRLVGCCTAAWFGGPDLWVPRAATARRDGTAALVDSTAERWFTPEFRTEEPGAVDAVRRTFVATADEGYAGCADALAACDLRTDLPRIVAPTLIVAGAHDAGTPPDTAARPIVAAIPGSRLEVVDDAAHLAPYERPDVVGPLIRRHLAFRAVDA
ncbi:MAG: 3-oxoadipate enol-lactonase [Solirubrobacteraceae bacterium]